MDDEYIIHFQAEKFTGVICKAVFFILVILIFIILPSTLFYYVEDNWTYLDCVYYISVSLTTIGFGDLTTAQGEQERFGMWIFAYNGFTVVWLILGLGFISMNNSLLADSIKKISSKFGNFSIIPLLMPIPTRTEVDNEEYDMSTLMHTTRRASDPCISFSARGSLFKPNLQTEREIARARSLKIPAKRKINRDPLQIMIELREESTELSDL